MAETMKRVRKLGTGRIHAQLTGAGNTVCGLEVSEDRRNSWVRMQPDQRVNCPTCKGWLAGVAETLKAQMFPPARRV